MIAISSLNAMVYTYVTKESIDCCGAIAVSTCTLRTYKLNGLIQVRHGVLPRTPTYEPCNLAQRLPAYGKSGLGIGEACANLGNARISPLALAEKVGDVDKSVGLSDLAICSDTCCGRVSLIQNVQNMIQ